MSDTRVYKGQKYVGQKIDVWVNTNKESILVTVKDGTNRTLGAGINPVFRFTVGQPIMTNGRLTSGYCAGTIQSIEEYGLRVRLRTSSIPERFDVFKFKWSDMEDWTLRSNLRDLRIMEA